MADGGFKDVLACFSDSRCEFRRKKPASFGSQHAIKAVHEDLYSLRQIGIIVFFGSTACVKKVFNYFRQYELSAEKEVPAGVFTLSEDFSRYPRGSILNVEIIDG